MRKKTSWCCHYLMHKHIVILVFGLNFFCKVHFSLVLDHGDEFETKEYKAYTKNKLNHKKTHKKTYGKLK